MGHIELSRDADLVVVAPATADLLAKMAHGLADDLASTLLLATDKKILVAPAMNLRMWLAPATRPQRRRAARATASSSTGRATATWPAANMGPGRMSEPPEIVAAIEAALWPATRFAACRALGRDRRAQGRRVVVTSGPTHEPIDPVRYIANRSSGKQGHAIAAAAARRRRRRSRWSPARSRSPIRAGVATVHVETAREMLAGGRSGACRPISSSPPPRSPTGGRPRPRPKN